MNNFIKEQVLTFNLDTFSIIEEDNDISIVRLRLYHLGMNRNKTYISKECSDLSIETFFNKPIVYRLNNKFMPNYSSDVVEHARGEDKTMNIAGTIPFNTTYEYVYDEEKDKTYFEITGIIYKAYQPTLMKILQNRDGQTKISIEMIILSGKQNKEGIIIVEKFRLKGIALLGTDVVEGIEGSDLTVIKFSQEDLNTRYNSICNKDVFQITENVHNDINSVIDIYKNSSCGLTDAEITLLNSLKNKESFNKIEMKILNNCFIHINNSCNTNFGVELKEKFIEKKEEDEMKLSINDLRDMIYKSLVTYYGGYGYESHRYYVTEIYPFESKIIVEEVTDEEPQKLYSFSYRLENNEVIIDIESKKEVIREYIECEHEESENAILNAFVYSKDSYGSGSSIKVNESKEAMSDSSWGSINKSALRKKVLDASNYKALVKKVYLLVEDGWEETPSEKLKFPVMELKGDELVYNRGALASAKGYAEANNYGSVVKRIEGLYKKLELDSDKEKEGKLMKDEEKKNKLDSDDEAIKKIKDDVDSDEDDEKEKLKKNKIEDDDEGKEDLEDDEDSDKDYWKKKYSKEMTELKAKCNAYEKKELETKMNALVTEYAECFSEEDKKELEKEIANSKSEEEFSFKLFACVAKNAKGKKTDKQEVLNSYSVSPFGANQGYSFKETDKKASSLKELREKLSSGGKK